MLPFLCKSTLQAWYFFLIRNPFLYHQYPQIQKVLMLRPYTSSNLLPLLHNSYKLFCEISSFLSDNFYCSKKPNNRFPFLSSTLLKIFLPENKLNTWDLPSQCIQNTGPLRSWLGEGITRVKRIVPTEWRDKCTMRDRGEKSGFLHASNIALHSRKHMGRKRTYGMLAKLAEIKKIQ